MEHELEVYQLHSLALWKDHIEDIIKNGWFNIHHIFYSNEFIESYYYFRNFISTKNIKISYKGVMIDLNTLDLIVNGILDYDESKQMLIRKKQLEGIKKAIIKKHEGTGNYGRPRISLPEDFDERIKQCRKEKIPLERYRKKIQMKKSTFYKHANAIIHNAK